MALVAVLPPVMPVPGCPVTCAVAGAAMPIQRSSAKRSACAIDSTLLATILFQRRPPLLVPRSSQGGDRRTDKRSGYCYSPRGSVHRSCALNGNATGMRSAGAKLALLQSLQGLTVNVTNRWSQALPTDSATHIALGALEQRHSQS